MGPSAVAADADIIQASRHHQATINLPNSASSSLARTFLLAFLLAFGMHGQAENPRLSPSQPTLTLALNSTEQVTIAVVNDSKARLLLIREKNADIEGAELATVTQTISALSDSLWSVGSHLIPVQPDLAGELTVTVSRMDHSNGSAQISLVSLPDAQEWNDQELSLVFSSDADPARRAEVLRDWRPPWASHDPVVAAQLETLEFLAWSDARDRQAARQVALSNADHWRAIGNLNQETFARAKAARFLMYSEVSDTVESELSAALRKIEETGEATLEYFTRNYLCLYYLASGHLQRGLECSESNIYAARKSGNPAYLQTLTNNLGGAYLRLGQTGNAMRSFQEALRIASENGLRSQQASAHNNLGLVLRQRGQLEEALEEYDKGLQVARAIDDRDDSAVLMRNIGRAYYLLKNYERSLDFLNRSAELESTLGDAADLALTRSQAGDTLRALGRIEESLHELTAAVAIAEEAGHSRTHAVVLQSLGNTYQAMGDSELAARMFSRVKAIQNQRKDRRGEASASVALAGALMRLERNTEALSEYQHARILATRISDPQLVIQSSVGVAEALFHSGNGAKAETELTKVMQQIGSLRSDLVLPEHKAAVTGASLRAYELALELSFDEQTDKGSWRSLIIAGTARDQALRARLRSRAQDGNPVPPEITELRAELSARLDRRVFLASSGSDTEAIADYDRQTSDLLRKLDVLEARNFDRVSAQYDQIGAQEWSASKLRAHLEVLPPEDLWLYYFLTEDRGYRWSYSKKSGLQSQRIPGNTEIAPLATELHSLWSTSTANAKGRDLALARQISRALFSGVELTPENGRILVIPHGPLELLPFAALPEVVSGTPILNRYQVSNLASLNSSLRAFPDLSLLERGKKALVFADPVFSRTDPRVKQSQPEIGDVSTGWNLLRLGASTREAQSIANNLGQESVSLRTGFAANRTALVDSELRFPILHLATHGLADDRRPEASGLMLSRISADGNAISGFVGLADIQRINAGTSLVVLTACETAIGSEQPGEGVASVSQAFLQAGADNVIATLWRVADPVAVRFTDLFYREIANGTQSPADALRRTQIQLRRDRRWRQPIHWAAFVLRSNQ